MRKTKGRADAIDKLVGSKVREVRLAKGLSQERVAEVLDVSFQQLQKYENGTNRISVSKLFQFSKHAEVKLEFFFSEAPLNDEVAEHGDFLTNFSNLSIKQRNAITKMTKELANA